MLVAENVDGVRRPAFEAEKDECPFTCPICKKNVVLKKGSIREHHYAHEPDANCEYGKGESQLHYKVKRALYLALKEHPNCQKCELERVLKGVRPDVSLVINKAYVAIEVQKSNISIEDVERRIRAYSALGIHSIWILPVSSPKTIMHAEDDVYRSKNWERHLHQLHRNRLYYWHSDALVMPYHYGAFYTYKAPKEWYDEYGNVQYGGDTWEEKKALKKPIRFPGKPLHLAEDFVPVVLASNAKIFLDRNQAWWSSYYDTWDAIMHDRLFDAEALKAPK